MADGSLAEKTNDKQERDASDGFPSRCLSFTVRGPWGHFRRIEGNVVKQTYRVIPRTTVAGLVAGILGLGRDSYYELFSSDRSAIAIEPVHELRTINLPMNTLSTADGNLQSLNGRGKLSVKLPDPTALRQQHNYEVLVDPGYRIDLVLSDTERYRQLRRYLEDGKSHYVPSLGLSEYLAEIEYHGEFEIEPTNAAGRSVPDAEPVNVDTAVPNAVDDLVLEPGTRCQIEESPAFMTTDEGGRTTTEFTTYAYNPDAETLAVRGIETTVVDDRKVVFV
ncbi:type I-B CRISPR-associated protein Cas5b [Halopenitus persicus]|uniref:CRISPR-associated protein Cas5h n=1 Tax=Halopenitus persicus TaxID=1048396 RepID=A0A1H3N4Z6_9EURY|nr:type I-B CRISPR-associated protein Cas5b [Halopenitus persicus]QHS17817.1 type I-B CRISPR-associated protein Cas5 [haloarchaeon 3A1-DGR]SDY84031.1 CRISPR-associated protein Cas5h [Halopenitus persicus]